MTPSNALRQIAFYRGRRDEVPNQQLARALAEAEDVEGIAEIAANLRSDTPAIQSDCVKVLYEIGYLKPGLIAPYASEFMRLLAGRNNRLVWGGMIALATISTLRAAEIWAHIEDVLTALEHGSLITVVWGIRTLAGVASVLPASHARILPVLAAQLERCDPRDLPQHAESVLPAIGSSTRGTFAAILQDRMPELTPAQARRLRKVLRQIEGVR